MDQNRRMYRLIQYFHLEKETKLCYDSSDGTMRCSCTMFEIEGFLCRHSIFVMKIEHMKLTPGSCMMN